ncbi:hypothetical protein FEN17_12940 [Dyadobacter luticola]|uniref:Uncharacterized protein n=1 Tax=Dyadobacter luticola TaxID=1979387 RepID=A0A5R9KVT6_9BACT|nr:hypothetical protein FEN17_12940 [Dyadobacter luticola]
MILVLLFAAATLPDYYINSPSYFNFADSIRNFDWLIFAGILVAGIILSGLLALIPLKNMRYFLRLLSVDIFVNTAVLLFIMYHGISSIVKYQREYEALSLKYKSRAESDIKNGVIIYETAGFQIGLDPAQQAKEDKIDSLRRTYGITYNNTGCMITSVELRAQSDYEQLTEPYLDRRNGAGWRDRMNLEIEKIRKH